MKMLIGGKEVDASNGATMNNINPANGQVIDTVPCASPEDVESVIEEQEMARLIAAFLDGLPADERRVFLCRYWYVESIETIAEKFGFSQSKVKTVLYRTRAKLRKHFAKEGYL